MKHCLSFLLMLAVSASVFAQKRIFGDINTDALVAHVGFLASDNLMGRQAGTVHGGAAADYIVSCLRQYGVKPFYDDYRCPFSAFRNERGKAGYWEVNEDSVRAISSRCHRRLDMNNVIGYIEGKDTAEYVIIGAHFDHLGTDETLVGDKIYNGADDNASGVAALLEIARNFAVSGVKPDRTVIFAFWDGEEIGLLGSRAFAQNFEMSKVKGYINFDMIGRTTYNKTREHVVYFYEKGYEQFRKWQEEYIKEYGLELEPDYRAVSRLKSGGDNATFALYGVPVIWYHTDGHLDYHQPSDHADKIDYQKMKDIAFSAMINLYRLSSKDFFE